MKALETCWIYRGFLFTKKLKKMVTKFNFRMNETDYLEIDNQESDLLFIRVKENDCVSEISIDKQHIQYLICLLQLLESKMD